MALHVQQQILDAVKAVLAAAGTAATSNVFLDRVDPLQLTELPGIVIEESPEGETSEPYTISGMEQRLYPVDISCAVADTADAAAKARALGLEVEKAIAGSTTLAQLARLGVRIMASRMTNTGDGDRLIAARQQRWLFAYVVRSASPDVAI